MAGAAIAFPLGMMVGGGAPLRQSVEDPNRSDSSGRQAPLTRNVYSPQVRSDPYVIEEQRKVLRALEVSCRQFDQYCREAEQARLRIQEAERAR